MPRRDPTPGLAVALLSQRILPRHVQHLKRKKASGWRSVLVIGATDGDINEAGDELQHNTKSAAGKGGRGGRGSEGDEAVPDAREVCPLTGFDIGAVEWCMPARLREIAAAEDSSLRCRAEAPRGGEAQQAFPALRIWVRAAPLLAPLVLAA